MNDICASIQRKLIDWLMIKLKKAIKQTGIKRVASAGGVSANSGLRNRLELYKKELGWKIFIPDFQYCTDNAGMVASAAYFKYLANDFTNQRVSPNPRLKFSVESPNT